MNHWQILVIEDESDSMEFVQGLLEHHGINSMGATTGEEALEMLERFRPKMIIIDLALPGLNGWDLLNAIKSNPALRKIPCVAITAYHTAELAERAIEAGFSAYFAKPLDATSFVRELEGIASN
jgi:two-component system cell cycle response regulator DivK